jgi:hypothetical protein
MNMINPQFAAPPQSQFQGPLPPSSSLVNVSSSLQLPQSISRVASALSRDLAGQIALFTGNPGLYATEYSLASVIGASITPGFSLSSWGTPEQGGLASNPTTASFPGFFQPIPTFPSLRGDIGTNSQGFQDPRFIPQGWSGSPNGFIGDISGGGYYNQAPPVYADPYASQHYGYAPHQQYGYAPQHHYGHAPQQHYGMPQGYADPYAQQSYGGSYNPMAYAPY